MESFFARLEARARERGTLLCVGLDPHPEDLATPSAQAARDFALRLIEATAPYALAFKPNAAFYEAYGPAGWQALAEVVAAARAVGAPVILDAKRGDIASTARAYARAAFEGLGADALTVNPYLGFDAVAPFVEHPARGVFLLCKTSNPGSADLQDVPLAAGGPPQPLYLRVARLAQQWNARDNLGLVVGATHPQALRRVREAAPRLWFLAPGVGAQGGDLTAALEAGLRADGLGLLVAVSRGISRAADPAAAAQRLAQATGRALRQGARFSPAAAPTGAPQGTLAERQPAEGAAARPRARPQPRAEAERLLWQQLRAGPWRGRFRRQHPIGPYLLDFYCAQARLAVEVVTAEEAQRRGPQQRKAEAQRARFLEAKGIQVLRFEAQEVLNQIDEALKRIETALRGREGPSPRAPAAEDAPQATIARALVTTGCVRFGDFTLKSGLRSPIYLDLRLLASYPALLALVAQAYADLLAPLAYDRLAALPYAALPIGTAVALRTGDPLIYPRKEVKAYGTRAAIEGLFYPGEQVVMLDDLATTGGSKLEAAEKLRAAGLVVREVAVLIDRQSGAREELAAHGLRLHAVFTLSALLDLWEAEALVPAEQIAAVRRWLAK